MRVLVFGAGAVGSLLGGLLAGAGHRVTLLGRPEHMRAIRDHGLQIDGIWGTHQVWQLETLSTADELAPTGFDLVLVTVKAYDTATAVRALRQLGTRDTIVVSVQNGYGNTEAIQEAIGRGRVFGARIITGVELPEPGRVTVTVSADDIRLGPPAGEEEQMPRAGELAALFRTAGIPVAATSQYREYLWAKILYNCALNPLGALLAATYGELAGDPEVRPLIDQIIDEAFAAARANRIPLFWDSSAAYRQHFYDELLPPTATHYPSMLRDLERRGQTEIDALNGAVVRLALAAGLDAPLNRSLTGMIRLRERTRRRELRTIREG